MWAILSLLVALAFGEGKNLGGMSQTFCSLQADGMVYCFGNNENGALGNGNREASQLPVLMRDVVRASDVAVGAFHSCVVDWGNIVKCVGANDGGALGVTNVAVDSLYLVTIASGMGAQVSQVYANYQRSCALLVTGGVRCWGENRFGALGDGSVTTRFAPVVMTGFGASGAVDVTMGYTHTCVLTATGLVRCVGSNSDGELGDGTKTSRKTPVQVVGFPNKAKIVAVAAGGWHTCAVNVRNEAYCWGYDMYAQLGQGEITGSSVKPLMPLGLQDIPISNVFAGRVSSFVMLASNSSIMGFGDNELGGLSTGDTNTRFVPTKFWNGKTGVKEVRGGFSGTCVLDQLDRVYCVGRNDRGEDRPEAALIMQLIPGFPDSPLPKYRKCKPTFGLNKLACERLQVQCKKESLILMEWSGAGCSVKGKKVNDAGCRCTGYCGYTCKAACNASVSKKCVWDDKASKCLNKHSRLPESSVPFSHCPISTI